MKSLFPILLCLLLLPLTACQPDFSGSRMGTPRGLHMSYTAFHTTEKQTLSLKAGEEIALSLVSQAGTLSITIWKGEEEPIYEGEGLTTQDFTVRQLHHPHHQRHWFPGAQEEAGLYTVAVTGQGAVGSVDITVGQAPSVQGT